MCGMFDHVKFEMPCPTCGTTIKGFQTKDTACMLDEVTVTEVCNFYSFCPRCKTHVDFFRKPKDTDEIPTLQEVLKEFQMDVQKHECTKAEQERRKKLKWQDDGGCSLDSSNNDF